MGASNVEVQTLVDLLQELLGFRVEAGSITIHLADGGKVQKVDHLKVWRPERLRP
jgi:hypothetical protein